MFSEIYLFLYIASCSAAILFTLQCKQAKSESVLRKNYFRFWPLGRLVLVRFVGSNIDLGINGVDVSLLIVCISCLFSEILKIIESVLKK